MVDLSKPAFGPDAEKVSKPVDDTTTSQVEEVTVEAPVQATETSVEEPETEEQKVPYSRFRKFHDLARDAQREAEEWRAKAEALENRRTYEPVERESEPGEVPSYWKELYGDSDASNRAWKIQERSQQELMERAEQRALEAVQSERTQETQRVQQNEQTIDQNLEALGDYAGHDLTEKEQSAVLDIVDEYTPKAPDGSYLGATIPFEKAWDIYEMQQQIAKGPRVESRNKVASLTGSQTQGEPSIDEKDKSFNPLDWGAYKKRI